MTPPQFKHKIILAAAFHGRSFTLKNEKQHGVNAILDDEHPLGIPLNKSNKVGMAIYSEICEQIQEGNLTEDWDEDAKVPFAYGETYWVGYENERSIQLKAEYVKENEFGGISVWTIVYDDFDSTCGADFPLLNAVSKTLNNYRITLDNTFKHFQVPSWGIALSVVAGMVCLVLPLGLWIWRRKKQRLLIREPSQPNNYGTTLDAPRAWITECEASGDLDIFEDQGKLIDSSRIVFKKWIGEGNFGRVYLADLTIDQRIQKVAVKTFSSRGNFIKCSY